MKQLLNDDVKISIKKPNWPIYSEREVELVTEVVKSQNWWRMSGNKVDEFEKKFAAFHNVDHCLAVTNGTHAIELSLASLGIGRGDEVIVPSFTFISTGTAVIYCNAKPIPVDVDPDTFCVIPEAIEEAITEKTKAIIPVHMAGHVCDMDRIGDIAKKHNLIIIEDAAHAHGAEWKGVKVGNFGDIAIFSFQNGKIMTCGEGGALVTNNKEIYDRAFLIHGVGRPKYDRLYKHLHLGSNYRMSEFQAAILIAQLERLENQNILREKNAKKLDELLSNVAGITPQKRKDEVNLNTHYMYMFYYDENEFNGLNRSDFVAKLNEIGVPAFIAYPPFCDTDFYKENNFRSHLNEKIDVNSYNLPYARRIGREVVWLPHFILLGDDDLLNFIADSIIKLKEI